ncbi:MAG: hypothetical protein V1742_10280 [Pseudomonadota bacterium]
MRQVLIDEMSRDDVTRLHGYLKEYAQPSSLEGLYWVDLTPDLLDVDQFQNKADQPFCFAVEVGDTWAKFEMLIRSRTNFKSRHVRYASRLQESYILGYSNQLIEKLNLVT